MLNVRGRRGSPKGAGRVQRDLGGGTVATSGTIQNYFYKMGSLKAVCNTNGKRRMVDDDDVDDGNDMTVAVSDGTAEVITMEMDLEMEVDTKSTRVGPKSGRKKRLVKAAKKIKFGLISNYFHLEGQELPRELNTKEQNI